MSISLSGSLLITGSITTTGGITISGSILSASYSATSSFSNDFTVLGNLTVFGTQSVQYITSSQLNISDNVITVNVASPGVRFGGLSVFDSGSQSSEATASLFWDSQQNHWIYQRESGSSYDGGMLISGPRNAAGLGNESGTTACMLLVGQGGDHLTSSMIYHSSTATCIPSCLVIGGVLSGSSATFSSTVQATSYIRTLDRFYAGDGTQVDPSIRFWNSATGLYAPASETLGFVTNTTEKMRITSGGNVGIGTCNPSYRLVVNSGIDGVSAGISGATFGIRFDNGGTFSSCMSTIHGVDSTLTGTYQPIMINGSDVRFGTSTIERIRITSTGVTNFSCKMCILVPSGTNEQDAIIIDKAGGFGQSFIRSYYANVPNYGMALRGGDGITAMYIQCQGYVGVGVSTPGYKFHTVSPDNNTTSFAAFSALNLSQQVEMWYGGIRMGGSNASVDMTLQSKGAGSMVFNTNASNRMTIDGSGNIGAPSGTNIYNASDIRLKQNITNITDGLTKISCLNPVKFNWIEGFVPQEEGKNMLGFIAQEVKNVIPEAVEDFGNNALSIGDIVVENPLRVNEKFIIPVLVKAIQELNEKVIALENK
jgi:hypothetical protein